VKVGLLGKFGIVSINVENGKWRIDGNFVVMEVGSENDEELEDVHDLNCYPCIYHLL